MENGSQASSTECQNCQSLRQLMADKNAKMDLLEANLEQLKKNVSHGFGRMNQFTSNLNQTMTSTLQKSTSAIYEKVGEQIDQVGDELTGRCDSIDDELADLRECDHISNEFVKTKKEIYSLVNQPRLIEMLLMGHYAEKVLNLGDDIADHGTFLQKLITEDEIDEVKFYACLTVINPEAVTWRNPQNNYFNAIGLALSLNREVFVTAFSTVMFADTTAMTDATNDVVLGKWLPELSIVLESDDLELRRQFLLKGIRHGIATEVIEIIVSRCFPILKINVFMTNIPSDNWTFDNVKKFLHRNGIPMHAIARVTERLVPQGNAQVFDIQFSNEVAQNQALSLNGRDNLRIGLDFESYPGVRIGAQGFANNKLTLDAVKNFFVQNGVCKEDEIVYIYITPNENGAYCHFKSISLQAKAVTLGIDNDRQIQWIVPPKREVKGFGVYMMNFPMEWKEQDIRAFFVGNNVFNCREDDIARVVVVGIDGTLDSQYAFCYFVSKTLQTDAVQMNGRHGIIVDHAEDSNLNGFHMHNLPTEWVKNDVISFLKDANVCTEEDVVAVSFREYSTVCFVKEPTLVDKIIDLDIAPYVFNRFLTPFEVIQKMKTLPSRCKVDIANFPTDWEESDILKLLEDNDIQRSLVLDIKLLTFGEKVVAKCCVLTVGTAERVADLSYRNGSNIAMRLPINQTVQRKLDKQLPPGCKVLMMNFPTSLRSQNLFDLIIDNSPCARDNIEEIQIFHTRAGKRANCWFKTPAMAEHAITSVSSNPSSTFTMCDARVFDPSFGCKVYITHIPSDADEDDLRDIFTNNGICNRNEIVSVHFLKSNGRAQHAYCSFSRQELVRDAVYQSETRSLNIHVRLAER